MLGVALAGSWISADPVAAHQVDVEEETLLMIHGLLDWENEDVSKMEYRYRAITPLLYYLSHDYTEEEIRQLPKVGKARRSRLCEDRDRIQGIVKDFFRARR